MQDRTVEKMPHVHRDGGRLYVSLHGVEHGMSDLEAEWLFLALGRELHPADMCDWFPSAIQEPKP